MEKALIYRVRSAVLTTGKMARAAATRLHSGIAGTDALLTLESQLETQFRSLVESPQLAIIGSIQGGTQGEITAYLDVLQGRDSYLSGEFNAAVSVGVEHHKQLVGAYVYDFMRDILYGGFTQLERAISSHRVPFLTNPEITPNPESQNRTVHWQGSTGLAMAHAATGLYDQVIIAADDKRYCWDVVAGTYLLDKNEFILEHSDETTFNYYQPQAGLVAYKKRKKNAPNRGLNILQILGTQ